MNNSLPELLRSNAAIVVICSVCFYYLLNLACIILNAVKRQLSVERHSVSSGELQPVAFKCYSPGVVYFSSLLSVYPLLTLLLHDEYGNLAVLMCSPVAVLSFYSIACVLNAHFFGVEIVGKEFKASSFFLIVRHKESFVANIKGVSSVGGGVSPVGWLTINYLDGSSFRIFGDWKFKHYLIADNMSCKRIEGE